MSTPDFTVLDILSIPTLVFIIWRWIRWKLGFKILNSFLDPHNHNHKNTHTYTHTLTYTSLHTHSHISVTPSWPYIGSITNYDHWWLSMIFDAQYGHDLMIIDDRFWWLISLSSNSTLSCRHDQLLAKGKFSSWVYFWD